MQNILHCRAGPGGDYAYRLRKSRERALAGRIEQTLGGQLLLALFKGYGKRAGAVRLHILGKDLVRAAGFVKRRTAAQKHLHPVLRAEAKPGNGAAEHNGTHLGGFILQGKVQVAGAVVLAVGDFTHKKNRVEIFIGVELRFYISVKL